MDKLHHLNKLHIHHQLEHNPEFIKTILKNFQKTIPQPVDPVAFKAQVFAVKDRVRLLTQFNGLLRPFYCDPDYSSDEAKHFLQSIQSPMKPILDQVWKQLQGIEWKSPEIKSALTRAAQEEKVKFVQVMKPLRYVLTGSSFGIDLPLTMELMGQAVVIQRLSRFL